MIYTYTYVLDCTYTIMLLIPDIHIHPQRADAIVATIRAYIDTHPDDDTIIFLGDYVYAFSYQYDALAKLLHMRISYVQSGKKLYILAGNHDWLSKTFVYTQAQKTLELLDNIDANRHK